MVCLSDKATTPITKSVIKWAAEELTDHFAYHHPNSLRHTCMDCGHQWTISDAEKKNKTLVCPHCGRRLDVKETRDRVLRQSAYFTMLTTRKGLQVLRVALLNTEHRKGEPSTNTCREICRYYINGKGQCEVIGLKRTMGPYLDCFSYYAGMELRRDNDTYSHLATFPLYPKMDVIPELERNGKSGRIDHFRHFMMHSTDLEVCWNSYKIAKRNHYHIGNISLWCDTIRMLRSTGKDIHNAHYVCPTDLNATHDNLVRKMEEKAERERRAEEMERAAKNEAKFKAMKGKYFGLIFTDGLISVRVLESVEEHRQEGSHMHHCVFVAGYYLKESSLIFSATINGERVETVEFDLKQFRVAQSRGVCNKNTEYHDRIVSLVNSNADAIRQRMRKAA